MLKKTKKIHLNFKILRFFLIPTILFSTPYFQNTQDAKNFPTTMAPIFSGKVVSNSIVPVFFSSAHNRIDIAGIRNKYNHGCHSKKLNKLACPNSKKLPK